MSSQTSALAATLLKYLMQQDFPEHQMSLSLQTLLSLTAAATATGNTITVTATGGTGFLQYSIGSGAPQNSNVFNNLPNGTYRSPVMDDNGCTATASATVFTNNIVVSAMVTGMLDCFDGTDGQITVTASGGMAPYEYSLNGGAFQNGNVFNNLAAGTYTAAIPDARRADTKLASHHPVGTAANHRDSNCNGLHCDRDGIGRHGQLAVQPRRWRSKTAIASYPLPVAAIPLP